MTFNRLCVVSILVI